MDVFVDCSKKWRHQKRKPILSTLILPQHHIKSLYDKYSIKKKKRKEKESSCEYCLTLYRT